MWRTYLEPLKARGIRLGSPAPSGNPNGKKWLQDWLVACNGGCNPDFMAIRRQSLDHFYSEADCYTDWYDVNATQFEEYVNEYYALFQKPIWVTEWACQVGNFKFDIQLRHSLPNSLSTHPHQTQPPSAAHIQVLFFRISTTTAPSALLTTLSV